MAGVTVPQVVVDHCHGYARSYCAGCPFIGQCIAPVNPSEFDAWVVKMINLIETHHKTG